MSVTQEVLRAAAVAVGALLVAGAFGGLLFAGAQSLRRAAVLPLAVRYAGARRIHVVSVLGVAVGVAALIVVLSVMNGLIAEHRRMLRGTLPDLTIRPEPRRDANRAGRMPGAFADYRRALDGAPHVAAIAPRYVYYGLVVPEARGGVFELARKGAWNAVEIRGIDPSLERRVSELDRWLGPVAPDELSGARERPWLFSPVADTADPLKRLERTSGLPKDAMIVGFGLAERLDLARGRRVEVATWTPEGESTASGRTPNMYFDVAGMFHAPEQDFEASTALVTIDAVRKLVSDDDSDFTEIAVRLDDESHAAAAREDAAKRLTGAGLIRSADEIVTWEDQRRPLLAAVENERSLIAILLFFIV
ncbi:MAG TPA: ABC transporter permease, partial [Planctomycetota bacterium]|nr:ABC transporter permease [Planctomycetota bacterium]